MWPRRRDLSVVWFSELVGDITWTRGVLVMPKMPTPDQTARVSGHLRAERQTQAPNFGPR